MEKLEKLLKEGTESKVIFVPGLNDAQSLFEGKEEQSDSKTKALNLHKDVYEIGEGLYIAGLGGSVPAYWTTGYQRDEESEVETIMEELPSFPYEDQEDIVDDLTDLWYEKV